MFVFIIYWFSLIPIIIFGFYIFIIQSLANKLSLFHYILFYITQYLLRSPFQTWSWAPSNIRYRPDVVILSIYHLHQVSFVFGFHIWNRHTFGISCICGFVKVCWIFNWGTEGWIRLHISHKIMPHSLYWGTYWTFTFYYIFIFTINIFEEYQ